jgi:glycosyltransferase involved in cell wall biosynthesis
VGPTPTDRPLRVAVAGLSLRFPHTGTGRYAREIIASLAARPDMRATVVLAPDSDQETLQLDRVRAVRAPGLPVRLGGYGEKLYWEQVGFRVSARRVKADVWYSPHFSMPLFPGCPTVISVLDMIPFTEPAYAASRLAQGYFSLVARAARQAAAVVTLSQHAKGEIQRLLGIAGSRVHVAEPGVDSAFSPTGEPAAWERARRRYGLPERYLLYVGGADERKNIGVLPRALATLPSGSGVPDLVVVAGEPKPGQAVLFPDWRAQVRSLGLEGRVRFVARVEEEDLAAVYRGADALCFPSRAEGFGLTPLEAMACGTAVICSNATSLPEAVGEAGLLVDPSDVEGWARAMVLVSGDADLRRDLGRRGVERAATFRWSDTGNRVIEVIRAVGGCAS